MEAARSLELLAKPLEEEEEDEEVAEEVEAEEDFPRRTSNRRLESLDDEFVSNVKVVDSIGSEKALSRIAESLSWSNGDSFRIVGGVGGGGSKTAAATGVASVGLLKTILGSGL